MILSHFNFCGFFCTKWSFITARIKKYAGVVRHPEGGCFNPGFVNNTMTGNNLGYIKAIEGIREKNPVKQNGFLSIFSARTVLHGRK